ncbi:hypothetical protein D918_09373 [Trichuris suis]|nr:hypothetical protein D918_09373 [Trichuris suis]
MEKMHQEEDINMAAEENPKTQQFQMGDRVWARDFHARLSQIDTQSGTRSDYTAFALDRTVQQGNAYRAFG